MTKALTQSNRLASNVDKLKEKRLIEHPPSLSSSANYVEYMTWMDLILANLKRHPDFRYQFLTAPPANVTDECYQRRLDDIYEFIKDKLDKSISQNTMLQQLVSSYTSSCQVYLWWKTIQEYFLPNTEFAKH